MQDIIEKIKELEAQWKALQPMKAEFQKKFDQKMRLEFNYNSNHIEGNTLTYGETELLLIFDDTKGNHTYREYEEMKEHDVAYQLIREWAKDTEHPLTEQQIKNLNKIILVRPFWKEAITADGQPTRRQIKVGDYKEFPNSVRLQNGEIFEYASPTDTPILMGELVQWYRTESEKEEKHPIELAALLHYKFVRIHPFDDGNGRISRLLMNYVLLKNDLPPVVVKSADKRNYLAALHSADTGDLAAFVEYIAHQLVWSLEMGIKAAKGESIEEPDDLDKEISLLKKELANENVLQETATVENIAQVIEENLIPLFQWVEEKCEGLKEFFFDYDRTINLEVEQDNISKLIGSKKIVWENVKADIHYHLITSGKKATHISYKYELKGLKKTTHARCFYLNIHVHFNEYYYTIKTDSNENRFPYGKKIDKNTLEEIAKPLIKNIIEGIKQVNNGK
ncbi:MAG: Fic family protein [Thermoflexibacter sp.]|jgi:Fic family protein|nr:Fic family protein [Thermoflexibacter sp.]